MHYVPKKYFTRILFIRLSFTLLSCLVWTAFTRKTRALKKLCLYNKLSHKMLKKFNGHYLKKLHRNGGTLAT